MTEKELLSLLSESMILMCTSERSLTRKELLGIQKSSFKESNMLHYLIDLRFILSRFSIFKMLEIRLFKIKKMKVMKFNKKEINWLNWKNWEMKELKISFRLYNLNLFSNKSKNFKTIKIYTWANVNITMRCPPWYNGMKLNLKSDLQSYLSFIK